MHASLVNEIREPADNVTRSSRRYGFLVVCLLLLLVVVGTLVLRDLHARLDPTVPEPFDEAGEYDRVRAQLIRAIEEIHVARGSCTIPQSRYR